MTDITTQLQKIKNNYHKDTLKITIDMAWPAIVESFFVAFAGLIDSLMVSSLVWAGATQSSDFFSPAGAILFLDATRQHGR